MFEQDYILRLARQIAVAVARMMGLRQAGRAREAAEVADQAYGELFGLPPGFLDAVDPQTLASLIGEPGKILALADLVEEEAHALEEESDYRAAGRRELAAALRQVADRRG